MQIDILDERGRRHAITGNRLLVFDDFGNPIMVAVRHEQGFITTAHALDDEFEDLLFALGLDKMTVVERLKVKNTDNDNALRINGR